MTVDSVRQSRLAAGVSTRSGRNRALAGKLQLEVAFCHLGSPQVDDDKRCQEIDPVGCLLLNEPSD
jgi:hypothetical protein